ncbi:MAG: acyl-CoA dehydrogenase [Alphaproteobacteria bacterium]|nr:acyl-CoA dehydrogenase [Alphaproteobacteria bacterium]
MALPPFDPDDPFLLESLLSEDERLVMATARAYAQEKLEPRVIPAHRDESFDTAVPQEMAALGLLAPLVPPEYGGPGASYMMYGLICREFERVDTSFRSLMSVQTSLICATFLRFASEDVKRHFLPKLVAGDMLGCFGLTEPDSGSDPGSMRSTAKRVAGGWLLNGAKMWISTAPLAGVAIVWAKAVDEPEQPIRGFVVPRESKGFAVTPIKGKLSVRSSPTGALSLQDVFVPESHGLAGARGLSGPFHALNGARFAICWGTVGVAEDCYRRARTYVAERKQFGRPLAATQLVQKKLADMATDIGAMQLMAHRLARLQDQGRLPPATSSIVKRHNAGKALEIARVARDMHGGNGITEDYRVLQHAINMETVNTLEGTHDVHALVIGRAITGHQAFGA